MRSFFFFFYFFFGEMHLRLADMQVRNVKVKGEEESDKEKR